MKEKNIRGKVVKYAESAREMRGMLSTESTQLLAQPGSAVAICYSKYYPTVKSLVRSMGFYDSVGFRKGFIIANLRILVSERSDNGRYSLVGGARELTESFEAAAYRELGEETSLKLKDLLFLGVASGGEEMVNIYPDGNAAEGIDALYFAMVPEGTTVREDSETIKFHWMDPMEISKAVEAGSWHPAQVKTVKLLLKSLVCLPEIYNLYHKMDTVVW